MSRSQVVNKNKCQIYSQGCYGKLSLVSVQTFSPEAAQYETVYVTAHKGPCRATAFHKNGKPNYKLPPVN